MIFALKRFSLLAAVTCLRMTLAAVVWATSDKAESKYLKLVGHDDLRARSTYKGHVQEQNGRCIAYVGHLSTRSSQFAAF